MIVINCRGAQGINFRRALNNFCRKNKVDIVALQEPRCSGITAEKTIKKLGFKNYVIAEARGFSGGIWLMWNRPDIQIQLLQNNFHFFHVQVSEKDMEPWLLTVVYASPRENERHDTWHLLRQIATYINMPWLMMGDFNEIAYPNEKKGGAPADVTKCQNFNSWINDCNLLEVTTAGTRFTWRGPKWNGRDRVFKKLDRVLCNVDWRLKYHEGFAKVLPRVQSDHHPILVLLKGETTTNRNRPFRFEVWVNPSLISSINNTLLVLIPKVDKPEFVSQFRPIALCNVVYKIITKVIVNRIKPLLDGIISPYQSSFIPGRTIHHYIIVAQEMVHSMARMKGNKMFMSIKIDLEKAYDRLNWNFVENCLIECKFPHNLINIIKHCISSPSFKILWNGDKTDMFTPSRGIRQGDPLSPYLFVICMERLSHIIADQVDAEYWKPMRAEASIEQVHCIMHCLDIFCQASGQKINNQKTEIYFSKNVDQQLREDILSHTGYKHAYPF
ncbi:unnamed protein product [Trifolium pratense]|uniref:Uncharacterized protein n=1 Tax=Trifolium pratense TaxID=57577 RepID=A0ACB0KD37_TRIPR|nr:unnamed protein product [Trifolium pratense]